MPIINSLLDNDMYKYSMMLAVLHSQPGVDVSYKFVLRNKNINLCYLIDRINEEIKHLCSLKFTEDELQHLNSLSFLKQDYIDYLRNFSLNEKFIKVYEANNKLEIRIHGPWFHTILFEVPVLAIVNELYFKSTETILDIERGKENLNKKLEKIAHIHNFRFADFGTRRRYSHKWQDEVIHTILNNEFRKYGMRSKFVGTSNVYFAKKYNIKPIGTMAHEWFQGFQQAKFTSISNFQKTALDYWAREFRGELGIALTDTISMDCFLNDFDLYFAKLFDGCRQDSGDPFLWGEKLIDHYVKLGIDPKTKQAVFSDGLDVDLAIKILSEFDGRIKVSFGIGTRLTNHVGREPLQIVLKMYQYDGKPVAKISDSPEKSVCEDKQYLEYLKNVFKI